jgi:hypothetical protein
MKTKLDLKKIIKLVIAVILSYPMGILFRDLAKNSSFSVNIIYFWTFIGVLAGIFAGLFI